MRTAAIGLTTILVLASGSFGPATADSARPLLVPGYEAARDLPGARELPDPKVDYKVVFADGQDAKNPGDVNPMLPTIATYVNTLGKYGVPDVVGIAYLAGVGLVGLGLFWALTGLRRAERGV